MNMRKLLATTAVIAGMTVPTVIAQTGGSKAPTNTKKLPPPPSPYLAKPGLQNRTKNGRTAAPLPPAPAVPVRNSRARSASRAQHLRSTTVGLDPTGRKDMAGKGVAFYPVTRSGNGAPHPQMSASRAVPTSKPPENPALKKTR